MFEESNIYVISPSWLKFRKEVVMFYENKCLNTFLDHQKNDPHKEDLLVFLNYKIFKNILTPRSITATGYLFL